MTIQKELRYESEEDFSQRFVLPMLQRMGFGVVVNYHGRREFGKDLIFAEIDRFGHVRYNALQVKYVACVTLRDVEGLISDCKQSFANPFRHPHTGASERIAAFYAVNGGSFSDEARDHFFNSLTPAFGANMRLLDGKALVALERAAAFTRIETVRECLEGVRIEIEFNREVIPSLLRMTETPVKGYLPATRLRSEAASNYLVRPVANVLPHKRVLDYWYHVNYLNRMLDVLGSINGTLLPAVKKDNLQRLKETPPKIEASAAAIESAIKRAFEGMGAYQVNTPGVPSVTPVNGERD